MELIDYILSPSFYETLPGIQLLEMWEDGTERVRILGGSMFMVFLSLMIFA